MKRDAWLFAMIFLAGCGEPEPSHFVPASKPGPETGSAERGASGKLSREVTAPKKIEMH